MLTVIARWIVRYWPALAEAVANERARQAFAKRAATIHVLAVRAERRKVGKQVQPPTHWGGGAS